MSYGGGIPLTPTQKHEINSGLQHFPDAKKFRGLNTTSQMALANSGTVGAPVMGPTRIKNTPPSLGL